MPSQKPVPTVDDFRSAAIDAVRAQGNRRADNHSGAAYDLIFGTSATLWAKECQFTRDLFRAIYVDDADGSDLTTLIQGRWGIARVLDTQGPGYATFTRPSNAAGGETFHEGTRLRIGSTFYKVSQEYPVAANALTAVAPIVAVPYGPGVAVTAAPAILDDELEDPTWSCRALTCADGTTFEPASVYRARARSARLNGRIGYSLAVITAAQNAGAAYVAAFASTGFSSPSAGVVDLAGFSGVYTGDPAYKGSTALSNAVTVALESIRALGAEVISGNMVPTPLAISGVVSLWDEPSTFDTNQLTNLLRGALLSDFYSSTSGGFSFSRDSLSAAMSDVSPAIQSVNFTSPTVDLGILTGTPLHLPTSLNRYQVPPGAITFTFVGPS